MENDNNKESEKVEKKEEDWIQKKWRPMMAVMYMMVCIFDFIVFPIMFTIVQFWETQAANDAFRQWQPLTLVGAGLFHMAMGAVLGITAWSRGQEKIAGVAANVQTPGASAGGFGSALGGMGGAVGGFASPTTSVSSFSQTSSYESMTPVNRPSASPFGASQPSSFGAPSAKPMKGNIDPDNVLERG